MKYTVEKTGTFSQKLTVTIEAERVNKALDAAARYLAKTVQIRGGYRNPHRKLMRIKRMLKKEIALTAAKELITSTIIEAMKQANLETTSPPELEATDQNLPEEGKEYTYTVEIETAPVLDNVIYKGLLIPAFDKEPSNEEIDMVVCRLQLKASQYKELDRQEIEPDDLVLCAAYLSPKSQVHQSPQEAKDREEEPEKRPLPPLLVKAVRSDVLLDPLSREVQHKSAGSLAVPCKHLVGKKLGQTVQAKFDKQLLLLRFVLSEGIGQEELDSLPDQVELELRPEKILEASVVPTGDELAKVYGFKSLLAMRGNIREQLREERQKELDKVIKDLVLSQLVQRNPFELPPKTLEFAVKRAAEKAQTRDNLDIEEQMQDLKAAVARFLRMDCLIQHIAKLEKIEVTDEEIDEYYNDLSKKTGKTIAYLKAKDSPIDVVRDTLLKDKVAQRIIQYGVETPLDKYMKAIEQLGSISAEKPVNQQAETESSHSNANDRADADSNAGLQTQNSRSELSLSQEPAPHSDTMTPDSQTHSSKSNSEEF